MTGLFPPGIFTLPFMQDAWVAGTAVAVVAALVGFFVVLRGSTFVAHAVPRGSFAGAAGAVLVGQSSLWGLAVFAALSALGIASLQQRRQHAVATALVLVGALGLGDLFLSLGHVYAPQVYALLFGQVVGISRPEVVGVLALSLLVAAAVGLVYRPLLLQSVSPHVAEARGLRGRMLDVMFLLLVSMTATTTVPVVGAMLAFSLMVGPAAAGSLLAQRPSGALAVGVLFSIFSLWIAIWLAFVTGWPVGFLVSACCLVLYLGARLWAGRARRMARTA